ncbi:O-antigen ligase family protein [Flaviflexus huanghaiensis]|uniref:O-antigen ligase family protein n=1 Tax=Flaviflexus huanghaiensis TaxID=1111473 RepID=UPI0015FCF4E9
MRPDAVWFVTAYLVVLLVIPADRRVGVLGGAGSPGALFAIFGLVLWGFDRVQSRRFEGRRFQPVSAALLFFAVSVLASYVVSSTMSLPAVERSVADTGLLRLAAMAGILLIAHDGIPTPERFLVLMRRISAFGGAYATLGLVQFFTRRAFVDSFSIPGLVENGWFSFGERAGFIRAISTAMHPLEAALVLAMILPIALTVAIYDKKRSAVARWYPVAAILFLSVLSVTRSALLGVVVVIAVLFWTWPRAVRQWMAVAIGFGLVAVYVGVPGMAGTIIGMFSGPDSSLDSRTAGYDTVASFVGVSPLFGRGLGTFLPSYRIIDNQFLLTLVETGAVGLAALLILICAACWAAVSMRCVWKPQDEIMAAFGYALLASVLAGSLLLALFDAFSFPQACGMFFLVIGLCGAYLNLCRAEAAPLAESAKTALTSSTWRRRVLPVVALVAMVGLSAAVLATPPLYYGRVDVRFVLPESPDDSNGLIADPGLTLYLAGVVEQRLNAELGGQEKQTTSAPLSSTGIRDGRWVHIPNVGGQWETSHDQPLIVVEVVGESPARVDAQLNDFSGRVTDLARTSQEEMGIPSSLHIRTTVSSETAGVTSMGMERRRAVAGLALLTLTVVTVAARGGGRMRDAHSRRRREDDEPT